MGVRPYAVVDFADAKASNFNSFQIARVSGDCCLSPKFDDSLRELIAPSTMQVSLWTPIRTNLFQSVLDPI